MLRHAKHFGTFAIGRACIPRTGRDVQLRPVSGREALGAASKPESDGPEPRTGRPVARAPKSPFAPLGLRFNPFCVLDGDELLGTLLDEEIWERARGWLAGGAAVIEFVGDRGWGKSTHMRVLQEIARRAGTPTAWTYVELGQRTLPRLPSPPAIWFIDEADRLSPRARRGVLRRAARGAQRLVIATHASAARECAACGAACLSVPLVPVEAAGIERFMHVRCAAARRADAPSVSVPRLEPAAAAALLQGSGGSLREVEATLYEVFRRLTQRAPVPPAITEADVRSAADAVQRTTTITQGTGRD